MEVAMDQEKLEARTREIGEEIFSLMKDEIPSVFSKDLWQGKLLDFTMQDETFKLNLFRFIDLLPAIKNDKKLIGYLEEYFEGSGNNIPATLQWGLKGAGIPLISTLSGNILRRNIEGFARGMIVDITGNSLEKAISKMWHDGLASTVDVVGEKVLSDKEAALYREKYLNVLDKLGETALKWEKKPLLEQDEKENIPRLNLSIKLTALYPRINPADFEGSIRGIEEGIQPILEKAAKSNASLTFDMEQYYYKDLVLALFHRLFEKGAFHEGSRPGIAIQVYLKDTQKDLEGLVELAKNTGRKINVRLVKGAYWDYETIINRQLGWQVPVFTNKNNSDAAFEESAAYLLAHHEQINLAIGSHNVRSIAHTSALAESLGLPSSAVEYQMLFGMAEPIKKALQNMGKRVRVYTPAGELLPGMAYFVRRLLENTSNESFLRHTFIEEKQQNELLLKPEKVEEVVNMIENTFENAVLKDFSINENRKEFKKHLEKARIGLKKETPLFIDGKDILKEKKIISTNPANPEEIIGLVSKASCDDINSAVSSAQKAFPEWRNLPAEERAAYLFKAAKIMERRRLELAAIVVYETGKGWEESDADVVEAIDFLNYYAHEIIRLGVPRKMGNSPGELNNLMYEGRGVGAVIAPWNFPIAILTGMTAATLACGNCVLIKPSSLSPVTAAKLIEILREAGFPKGTFHFLPGDGSEIGNHLVTHPGVDIISFTGSREVGLGIKKLAGETKEGQKGVKKVIAEMGGKNAIIIDETADIDEAVPGVISSAFSYQGQKCSACSRVLVHEDIYDDFLERLISCTESLLTGSPENPAYAFGPMISEEAMQKVQRILASAKNKGRIVYERKHEESGYYFGPVIITDLPTDGQIMQEELFAPVLAVAKFKTINEALKIANATDYALTGGLYSRSPRNIELCRREFDVGNLYINRKITGAIVNRQPFGGFKMSGIGSKAGGPDYLLQFLQPRLISENTMRRGFAPDS